MSLKKMKNDDGTWTEEAKRLIWNKAPLMNPSSSDSLRLDSCNALMDWYDYGNRDSDYGWEIDHVIPEKILQENNVPQELIDHIDNLRPMHWRNNIKKGDSFPKYSADTSHAGSVNLNDVCRDYCVNRDQINVLRQLFMGYLEITHPTILGQWQVMIDRDIAPSRKIPATILDEIISPSIYDLD